MLCATRYALMMLRYAKTKSFSDKVASRDFIPESGDRMTDVHKVTLQVRAPRGTFPGEVVEGWYVVIDNAVVLTDAAGKPINGEKHHLAPGQDAHLLACRLIRQRRNSGAPRGFNDRIHYPKLVYRDCRDVPLGSFILAREA